VVAREPTDGNVEEGDINALLRRESMAFVAMARAAQNPAGPEAGG